MKHPRYEYYQDEAGRWRFRVKAANCRILADSGQSYRSEGHVLRAMDNFRDTVIYAARECVRVTGKR